MGWLPATCSPSGCERPTRRRLVETSPSLQPHTTLGAWSAPSLACSRFKVGPVPSDGPFRPQAPGLSSQSDELTITMDDTPPTVPSDLTPCTPGGLVSPTGLGSAKVSWFQAQSDYVRWCWTSPVRRAALGTVSLINYSAKTLLKLCTALHTDSACSVHRAFAITSRRFEVSVGSCTKSMNTVSPRKPVCCLNSPRTTAGSPSNQAPSTPCSTTMFTTSQQASCTRSGLPGKTVPT